jgi:imidazoleglycerol phosphate dehydratase HisB
MNSIKLQFGDVRGKSIITPNQFVSHMIEHIAWRLGVSVEVLWQDRNWKSLGVELGRQIKKFTPKQNQGVALGMIDDGSAEILIDLNNDGLRLVAEKNVNLKRFLSSRCEQMQSGKPFIDLLQGLCVGLNTSIFINISSFEDPHHTWEAVFRGIGIALNKIFCPVVAIESSQDRSMVLRQTAETQISAKVYFNSKRKNKLAIVVDKSINVKNMEKILQLLADIAGFKFDIQFKAKVLSSSHVVMEDLGLVLGKACLKIFKSRMAKIGANGAGSSIQTLKDLKNKPVRVGLSVEGRKFCRIFSGVGEDVIRQKLLIGQDILGNLRSEDLDDFLDGFAGGMGCSLLIVVKKLIKPEDFWQAVFAGIGEALREAYLPNPYRKGVPPGVKANLA